MVCCGDVWCGVVWCGLVWFGVVWCGLVWCGVVWCGVVCCGVVVVWYSEVWCGVMWCRLSKRDFHCAGKTSSPKKLLMKMWQKGHITQKKCVCESATFRSSGVVWFGPLAL